MPRTPLTQLLRQLCSVAAEADRRKVDVAQAAADHHAAALSRREFIDRSGKAGLFALAGSAFFGRLASAAADASVLTSASWSEAVAHATLAAMLSSRSASAMRFWSAVRRSRGFVIVFISRLCPES